MKVAGDSKVGKIEHKQKMLDTGPPYPILRAMVTMTIRNKVRLLIDR